MFKRKTYAQLLQWKQNLAGDYACLLEGARRVGKSTIAEEFAKNEYKTYIRVDFANITGELLDVFSDIANLDRFFLRLQAETGIILYEHESVIIFDEIQLYPKARQAIKYLVKDARYHYIETGSLISIKKNVKDIVIPSEEHRISVNPMDYEEFMWAVGENSAILENIASLEKPLGNSTNRTLMRNFRLYMAIGGMPQAVDAYIRFNNFERVDQVKREIINLYMDDLKKIDPSGRLSDMFKSVPNQLALKKKHFVVAAATGKRKSSKDEERLFDLIDSKIVQPCYHVTEPSSTLFQTREPEYFKLYLSDTGLFTTMLFNSGTGENEDIYKKLLNDKLDANLGYLYENVAAQIIVASGRNLYFHTWRKVNSTHSFEVDFLISQKNKVIPIEIKSSATRNHESIDQFGERYGQIVGRRILFSQQDVGHTAMLELKPMYMLPFVLDTL